MFFLKNKKNWEKDQLLINARQFQPFFFYTCPWKQLWSHAIMSGSDITTGIKIDKPLVLLYIQ